MNAAGDFWERASGNLTTRQRTIALAVVFVVSMAGALAFVKPINTFDFDNISHGMGYLLRGTNPYWSLDKYQFYFPPWSVVFLWPLAFLNVGWMVALDVAIWIIYVLARGKPTALLLLIHPLFILLIASGNSEIVGLVFGIWLVQSNLKGWPRGVALLLLTIKFQTVFLLILLEGVRILLDRDWQAVAVIGAVAIPTIVIFPQWIPNYFVNPAGAWGYPFSVIGTGGVLAALAFTALILLVMRRRLDEWRTMAIFLSLVWTPYVLPFSFIAIFIPLARAKWWRVLAFLGGSIALLPFFFQKFHYLEREGTILMLALALLLCERDAEQTEYAVAERYGKQYPWLRLIGRVAPPPAEVSPAP